LECLLRILNGFPISAVEDSWHWRHDPSGLFSVKSAFLVLRQLVTDEVFISEEETCLLPKVWKTWAPSEVAVFSWQLLQDRLSTRLNLRRRGVILDDSAAMCPLCA
jgi:hypothetical protein